MWKILWDNIRKFIGTCGNYVVNYHPIDDKHVENTRINFLKANWETCVNDRRAVSILNMVQDTLRTNKYHMKRTKDTGHWFPDTGSRVNIKVAAMETPSGQVSAIKILKD